MCACVWGETKRESKLSAAFVFQIRLMDLAQIKSLGGVSYALRDLGESMWRKCVCFRGKYSQYRKINTAETNRFS